MLNCAVTELCRDCIMYSDKAVKKIVLEDPDFTQKVAQEKGNLEADILDERISKYRTCRR